MLRTQFAVATILGLALCTTAVAQTKPSPLAPYIKESSPTLVLEHVRIIDGTGAAPREDMSIDIAGGRITAIHEAAAPSSNPGNARVLAPPGKPATPGLVGMHEHLFYPLPNAPADGLALYGEAAD